ncbi:Putative uncharacterized protein [Moritella viscosa]|uniref:DUF2955 domain-containing protein n=1 Tax=Moritella viscosa TaxID=80854 RepID=UPI000508FA3B|nr:DUF2955 domain-containing protein [Moritella viscosa]CED59525.1 membrane protein [Moritella viscosa]SHO20642.1 Putative uncharacterized protein [Moritella viscosa]
MPQSLKPKNNLQEALRISFTITLCMMLGKILNFDNPVYLALYPTMLITKGRDFSWLAMSRTLAPSLISAALAVFVSELFYGHPFIIWTISLLFFDQLRRRADTPIKLAKMILPCFHWVLMVIFSQSGHFDMPGMIRECFAAMVIAATVTKLMITLFPVPKLGKLPQFKPQSVTYGHRLVSLALIGSGLGFLLVVDMLPATFCMVPVISAAIQFNRGTFIELVEQRFITQIAGCAIAGVFIFLMSGHQSTLGFYALSLGSVIFILTSSMLSTTGFTSGVHADTLLATILPIQLYMGNNSFGLDNTFLRAWQLFITLTILFIGYRLTISRDKHEQENHPNPRTE